MLVYKHSLKLSVICDKWQFNHWVLHKLDQINTIVRGQGDTKSYLQQPVIVSPVIRQTKVEEAQTISMPH